MEGRYTLCVLFEYAATLGLLDVTYTDPAGARDDFRENWGVWSVTATALLAALDTGRSLEEFSRFLGNRCHTELPSTVTTLIDDVAGRTSRLRDLGMTQLVECAEPALATLIANDRKLRALCRPVGDRHLAIPPEHSTAFRKELRTLGYALR